MKNVHLIAACGVGMASLAGMLKEKGCRVTGSDANVYPPMSTQLASLGIDVIEGYGPCLLYTSPSPRDISGSRMPSSA